VPEPIPEGFTIDDEGSGAKPIPTDATIDDSGGAPGSVFESTGQKLKRVLVPAAASAIPAVAGAEEGAAIGTMASPGIGTAIGGAVGAGIGGAFSPYIAEQARAAVTGQPYQRPSLHDVATSVAWNAGLTGLGGAVDLAGGKYEKVSPEIKALPQVAQTGGNIKQAMRTRDFWGQMGLNDSEIDRAMSSPDLQNRMVEQVENGQRYKGAFQKILDHTRGQFEERYRAILGGDKTVNAAPIGQTMEAAAQSEAQHELTPTFRNFLQRKGLELTRAGETTGPSVGGVPWKQLPEKLKAQLQAQGAGQGVKTPTSNMSVQELRDLRTELRENLPSTATNLDKKVYQGLNQQITQSYESQLTPEQRAQLGVVDAEYGRFQDTVRTLDPRQERYGAQVANALFSPMVKNSGDALNFIKLAKEAEAARPGEVMPQLRQAFLGRAIDNARIGTQGRPFEELKALRQLQEQWGGEGNLRLVLNEMFPGSPLIDATKFSKVLGALSRPDEVAANAAQGIGRLKPPAWLLKIGGTYALYSAMTGSPTSPWTDMHKDPMRFAAGMAAAWAGLGVASKVLGSSDTGLKKAYVDFLLNPDQRRFRTFGELLGAGGIGFSNTQSGVSR
jgi:hypothetical protein